MPTIFESLEKRELLSTTYFVSNTGNDNNVGTSINTAFATLQHGVSVLTPGSTLDIEAGTYAGFIVGWDPQGQGIYGVIAGTAGNQITIQADPNVAKGSVIINSRENKTANGIDFEPGCDYITLNGITVENSNGSISNEGIKDCGNFATIENCTTFGVGKTGIFGSFSSNSIVENNLTYNNGEHGIYWSNSPQNCVIENNISHDNQNGGIQVNADASQGGPGTASNVDILDNIIYNNGTTGGGAINLDGVQNSLIENNLLYNNHSNGIVLYDGDASEGCTNDIVANNTVDMASNSRWAVNINTNSIDNTLFNNILFNDNTSNGSIEIDSSSLAGFASNDNILTGTFTTGGSNLTLAQWQSQTGQDKNSKVSTDTATFISVVNSNYQLSNGSLALGAGVATFNGATAATNDILGNSRPGSDGYDDGAYQSNAQQITPVLTSISLTPTNVSLNTGQTQQFTAIGLDQNGNALANQPTFIWSTTGGSVTQTGLFTAQSTKGSDTITVSSNGIQTSTAITITQVQVATSISITPNSVTLNTGTTQQFIATILDQNGNVMNGTVTWATTNGTITSAGLYTTPTSAGNSIVTATLVNLSASANIVINAPSSTLTDTDIGSPGKKGSATLSNGVWTVKGGGSDIWTGNNQFNFLYEKATANTTISTEVLSMPNTTNDWEKAGVMFRDGISPNAAFIDITDTGGEGIALQYRTTAGGTCFNDQTNGVFPPAFVKLVKVGNQFTAFYSKDGTTWKQLGKTITINMTNPLVGLAVTSHNNNLLATVNFSNLNILLN